MFFSVESSTAAKFKFSLRKLEKPWVSSRNQLLTIFQSIKQITLSCMLTSNMWEWKTLNKGKNILKNTCSKRNCHIQNGWHHDVCLASNTMCTVVQPCFLWPTTAVPLPLSPQSRRTAILQLHPQWEAEEERLQHMLLPSALLYPFMSKLLKEMRAGSSLRSLRGYGI